jgi:hypothetical protein
MTLSSMLSKQEMLREMGFKPADSLEEALKSDFIIDTGFGSQNDIAIYAVTDKAKIKSGVLCLHDTIIRHLMSTDNLKHIITDDYIAQNLSKGNTKYKCPYSFSQEQVEKKHNLWVLDPEFKKGHPYWRVHVKERIAFIRRYNKDIAEYSTLLQANHLQK